MFLLKPGVKIDITKIPLEVNVSFRIIPIYFGYRKALRDKMAGETYECFIFFKVSIVGANDTISPGNDPEIFSS